MLMLSGSGCSLGKTMTSLNLNCEKPQEMAGRVSVVEPELGLWRILGESSKRGRNSTF